MTKEQAQEALDYLVCQTEQWEVNHKDWNDETFSDSERAKSTLQQLIDKSDRLLGHVKLAIKMLEQKSPYAIETLKEVIEQDWSDEDV